MGLIVLGLQQSSVWGWGSVATWACIVVGVRADGRVRRAGSCARPTRCCACRSSATAAFSVDNAVLGLMSIVFVPFFFFASVYAQVSLGESSSNAGLYILYFFIGFVVVAQIGGRILDRRGARPAVVLGCALGAVGFYLLAGQAHRPLARRAGGRTSSSPARASA